MAQVVKELQGKVLKLSEVKKLGLFSSRKSILDLKATVIDLNKQLEEEKAAHQLTEQEWKTTKKEKKDLSKQLDTAKEGKETAERECEKLSDENATLKSSKLPRSLQSGMTGGIWSILRTAEQP